MAVLKYYDTGTSSWQYIAASTTANFTTWKKTMAGGETSVSGTDDNAVTLSYTVGLEQVFINGVLQVRGSDYTATNGTSITGLSALSVNDIVSVICYAPFNVANTIAPTVVDAKGDLIVATAADTVGRLAVGTNGQTLIANSGQTSGLQWITGGVLQVAYGSSTTQTDFATSTYADSGLSVSITPKFSTSKIIVGFTTHCFKSSDGSDRYLGTRLLRGATVIATPTEYLLQTGAAEQHRQQLTYFMQDEPATTSSTTYKLQGKSSNNNSYVRVMADSLLGTIFAIEVSA